MSETITCSVKDAIKLMEHLNENDMVTLTIVNKRTMVHKEPRRIEKKKGEEFLRKADNIEYEDNDFFGRFSLYGVVRDKNIIHNILFPQTE